MSGIIDFLWSRRDNILLFIASLVISLLLFVQLQTRLDPNSELQFDAVLEWENLPEDLVVVQSPQRIKVVASGSKQQLDRLDTARITAKVNLSKAADGVARYLIGIGGSVPRGVTISPDRPLIEIGIEEMGRRTFEIEVSAMGVPPGAYTLLGLNAAPSTAVVSGPKSVVSQVKSVRAIVDVTQARPGSAFDVRLEALGDENRPVAIVEISPEFVSVSPALSLAPTRRPLFVTASFIGQVPFSHRFFDYSVEPTEVEIRGSSDVLSRLRMIGTASIDLTGLTESTSIDVALIIPAGVELVGEATVRVTLDIRRR
ncbi:MAG: hypothetical protein IH944_06740 [Armatimonadetes bacterium]|nr:hypothetical protein [Armatimonadota bacterium]